MKKSIQKIYNLLYKWIPCEIDIFERLIMSIVHTRRIDYIMNKSKRFTVHSVSAETMPCIYVDVSDTTYHFGGAGTFRVLSNICHEFSVSNKVVFVQNFYGKLITSHQFEAKLKNKKFDFREEYVQLKKGDILFFFDVSIREKNDVQKIIENAKNKEVFVVGMIHDLFAITHPQWFDSYHFCNQFKKWNEMLLDSVDAIICNSKTTADNVVEYYKYARIKRNETLAIYYFHLGYSKKRNEGLCNRKEISAFVERKSTFLMVGTIEPRKGHEFVYDVFSSLAKDKKLLIIGRNGWKNDSFKKKYLKNKNRYTNIKWFTDITDAELSWIYLNCTALISASLDEGFGLPLIEAASNGVPIICSDIPIYHEVTENNATFFSIGDEKTLRNILKNWARSTENKKNIKIYTWAESADEIMNILLNKVSPYVQIK